MISLTDAQVSTKSKALFVFCICCFYAMMPSMGIMTPIFAAISAAYPDIPFVTITYIGTLVALFQIFGALAAGAVVGKFVRYRTALIIAFCLYLIGGLLPAFFPDGASFGSILVCRAIFGFGLGINAPMGATLITRAYRDTNQRAKMIGFGMVFFNLVALLNGYLGAFLATLSWNTAFFGHLIGLIGLVAAILLKEPESSEEVKKEKMKITPRAILWPLVFAIDQTLLYSLFTMGSMVLASGGIPVETAGFYQATGISMLTGLGIVLSFCFGWIYKALKKWVVALGICLVAIGLFVVGSSGATANITAFLIGWFIAGVGQQGVTVGLPMVVSTVVDKATAGVAMGLTMACMNLGSFLSTPWASFAASVGGATEPGSILKFNGMALGIFAVIMIIVTLRLKSNLVQEDVKNVPAK